MKTLSIETFLDRLNPQATSSLERALELCQVRGNPHVELAHWFKEILALADSDVHRIVRHFPEIDESKLAKDLVAAMNRFPTGVTSSPDLSVHVTELLQRGWVHATLQLNHFQLRTGHLLLAACSTPGFQDQLRSISRQFDLIDAGELAEHFDGIVRGSIEDTPAARAASGESQSTAPDGSAQQAMERFTVDLTAAAESGELDPILGRDDEIDLMIQILMKRRQNNPILTGDAGVGKTAVVEGLAQRIVAGDVPPPLANVRIRALDLGLLQAGAGMRGEFENRLRQVIDGVQSSAQPIILFIDEAHTLIGAGGQAGQGDAANLLKPALARGKLRTIAATTWAEYKLYFERDPALTRRFQVVKVEQPSEEKCLVMMRGLKGNLERDHGVHILDEALAAAVRLPARYIPSRQLPDKAVSVLDAACAAVAIAQHATPPELAEVRRRIEAFAQELEILQRETDLGADHDARAKEIAANLKTAEQRRAELESRWSAERDLVKQIIDVSQRLTASPAPSTTDRAAMLKQLSELNGKLTSLQGERPMVSPRVATHNIAQIIASWTGIPVGKMLRDEAASVLALADTLQRRVVGQRHALERIADVVMTSRSGMHNPTRPLGVFLLVGPSGVGKTETALALAEALYGGEQNVITINMSEFGEPHSVSTLKGSPPGYVGYGEGGVLTEAVRRRPYSVVLLDEIEKAHTAVHQLFFQVFDKGNMEDGSGRSIDFKNTIFLLTSNAGSALVKSMCQSAGGSPDVNAITEALLKEKGPLRQVFSPAFLGRLEVVPYLSISDAMLRQIIGLQLNRLARRVAESQQVKLTFDDAVTQVIAARCTEVDSGARVVEAILNHSIISRVSREYLTRLGNGPPLRTAHVAIADGQFAYNFQ